MGIHEYAFDLHKGLNKHKHAFYFRKVKQWDTCICVSSSVCFVEIELLKSLSEAWDREDRK